MLHPDRYRPPCRYAPLSRSDTVGAQLVAEALCEQRGRRLTPIRRKVLELLLRHGRSLKAYELLDAMREVHPGAAPPTVYRALDFLMDEGLVHRLDAVNAWSACHDAGARRMICWWSVPAAGRWPSCPIPP